MERFEIIWHFENAQRYFQSCLIISEAFSPIIMHGALVLPLTTNGMMEASATRKFLIPYTRSRGSTTASTSLLGPILHVPA